MVIRNLTPGLKLIIGLFLVIVLGSCAIVNYDNSRVYINYTLDPQITSGGCTKFTRIVRLNHNEPIPPKLTGDDIDSEEFADIVLTYAEALKKYIDNEKKYLAEDVARHVDTCK